jgi:ribonuclease HI
VENKDLVADIREKIEERESLKKGTFFVWVKGHSGDPGNVAADQLAVAGSLMGRGVQEQDDSEEGENRVGESKPRLDVDDTGDEEKAAFEAMDRAMEDDSDQEFK